MLFSSPSRSDPQIPVQNVKDLARPQRQSPSDPDETLLLETTTRGDDLIPPPDTAPTAMTAALIVEPAGDVEQEFRRANHYVTGAMPGRSGKRKQRPSIWNL